MCHCTSENDGGSDACCDPVAHGGPGPDNLLALLHRWCSLEGSYVLARYRHLPARLGNAGDNPVVLLHMAK